MVHSTIVAGTLAVTRKLVNTAEVKTTRKMVPESAIDSVEILHKVRGATSRNTNSSSAARYTTVSAATCAMLTPLARRVITPKGKTSSGKATSAARPSSRASKRWRGRRWRSATQTAIDASDTSNTAPGTTPANRKRCVSHSHLVARSLLMP